MKDVSKETKKKFDLIVSYEGNDKPKKAFYSELKKTLERFINMPKDQTKVMLLTIAGSGKDAWVITVNWLEKYFGFKRVYTVEDLNLYHGKNIDIILVPYSFNIASNLQMKKKFLLEHKEARYIHFKNEYNLPFSTWLKEVVMESGKKIEALVSFEYEPGGDGANYIGERHFVNVNCLIHRDYPIDLNKPRPYGIIYWGTFRKGREEYFQKYFDKDIFVSTSAQNIPIFRQSLSEVGNTNNLPKFIEPIFLRGGKSELQSFRYSLYIEDRFSHIHYTCPANRYYEALNYGVIQIFDENCLNTFNRYGIDITPFIVGDKEDLKKRMKEFDRHRAEIWAIQSKWKEKAREDIAEANQRFKEIFNEA